jgi:NarL family two-component system response regulator LiaR
MQEVAAERDHATQALTGRELAVLRLIARGLPNKQIARQLGISEKTVKTHVSNILAKLHLADRTQAALYAVRERLVDLE